MNRTFNVLKSGLFILLFNPVILAAQFDTPVAKDTVFVEEPIYGELVKAQFKNRTFNEFCNEFFRYPMRCMDDGISGATIVRFVVEKDGSVSNLKIVKPCPQCKEFELEAIRVVKMSSKLWIPAEINGKVVRSYYELPLSFKMD